MSKYGWAGEQVKLSVEKAFELLKESEIDKISSVNLISAYWSLITFYHLASERIVVKELTQKLINLSKQLNNIELEISAIILKGVHLYVDGEFESSISNLELALLSLEENSHIKKNLIVGIDNLVYASSMLAQVLWLSGKKQEGEKLGEEGIARAREINHIPSICLSLLYRSAIHQFAGEKDQAIILTNEILELANKYGLVAFTAYAATLNNWGKNNIKEIDDSVGMLTYIGCKLGLTYYMSLPAQNEFEKGEHNLAIDRIDKCLLLCEEMKEYFYKDELLKMKSNFIKLSSNV